MFGEEENKVVITVEDEKRIEKEKEAKKKLGERFLNEGKERTIPKLMYITKISFFTGVIPTFILIILLSSYLNTGKLIDEIFIQRFIENIQYFKKEDLIKIAIILTIGFSIVFIFLLKKINRLIKYKKIADFVGLCKWEIKNIQYKKKYFNTKDIDSKTKKPIKVKTERVSITFELKENESTDNAESIKSNLKSILNYFGKYDGSIEENTYKSIRKKELILFEEKELEYFDQLQIESIKQKIITNKGNTPKWKLKEITRQYLIYTSKQTESFDKGELESAAKTLPQFLGKKSAKIVEHSYNSFKMVFKNQIPSRKDKLPKLSTNTAFKEDCMFLGVHDDIEKIYCYTSPVEIVAKEAKTCKSCKKNGKKKDCKKCQKEEKIRKQNNTHKLIVGGSGSGKSFFIKNFLKNLLNKKSYKDTKRINIVNLKGSNDFEDFKDFDKVEVTDAQMASAYYRIYEAFIEMNERYIYMKQYGYANYPGGDFYLLIDEAQTINDMANNKSLTKLQRNTWEQMALMISSILAKGRAAGVWVWLIMQKGTAENIPGGITSRDNIMDRIALLNNNMSLLLDAELIEKHNIQADKLQSGQFVFMDVSRGEDSIIEGFVQEIDYELDPENVTKELDTKEEKERNIELKKFGEVAFKAEQIEKEYIEELEESGKMTTIDNLQDFNEYKDRDFIQEAIDFYDKNKDGTLSEEEIQEAKKKEKYEKIELDDLINETLEKSNEVFDYSELKNAFKKREKPMFQEDNRTIYTKNTMKIDKKIKEKSDITRKQLNNGKWNINNIDKKIDNDIDKLLEEEI